MSDKARAYLIVVGCIAVVWAAGAFVGVMYERWAQASRDAELYARADKEALDSPMSCTQDGDDTVCRWRTSERSTP